MSDEPILLFLHGVGDGDHDDSWRTHLNTALQSLGYPELNAAQVIAPKYAHALKDFDEAEPLPGVTIKQLSRDAAKQNRRDFERRMGAIEYRLGQHDRGLGWVGGDVIINAAVGLGGAGIPKMAQAHNYIHNPQVRAQVLNRILSKLPESGRLVIVGHSLGSVITADLLPRLPVGLNVVGMVTIGSPLANGSFVVEKLRDSLKEPPTNLAWWVNFWNAADIVAAHRGVSSVFPWIIDFRIDTKRPFPIAHAAAEYLANEAVAAAVGFAFFGSRSKDLAEVDLGTDMPLDFAESLAVTALRYAHLAKEGLNGDQLDRFTGALRHVQAAVVDDIKRRNVSENRPMPKAVARLAFDLSDPKSTVPMPPPSGHMTKEEAAVTLTILASENVISPFEISIARDTWQSAMKELGAEMGLGTQFGAGVFSAAKDAHEALRGGPKVNWVKWGALGAGAALIVVATGGLALAAGAGLAGAAAIVSALAAFGPGGMIGGLLTAGTLLTAGGSGIAYGLASPGTTAETLEAVIERQLAMVILQKRQGLDPSSEVWTTLVETEIEVRREHERLDEFSDENSPAIKELKRKIATIERGLKYMRDQGLEPRLALEALSTSERFGE